METLDIAEFELPSGTAAIVDTNVMVDVWPRHDLFEKDDRHHALVGPRAIDHLNVRYLRWRARQSLLLAT